MGAMSDAVPSAVFFVQASPAGGFRVMLGGHPVPISRHDTEEEAVERMHAYQRGVAAALSQALEATPQEGRPYPPP
jgi:hypothetical protein